MATEGETHTAVFGAVVLAELLGSGAAPALAGQSERLSGSQAGFHH